MHPSFSLAVIVFSPDYPWTFPVGYCMMTMVIVLLTQLGLTNSNKVAVERAIEVCRLKLHKFVRCTRHFLGRDCLCRTFLGSVIDGSRSNPFITSVSDFPMRSRLCSDSTLQIGRPSCRFPIMYACLDPWEKQSSIPRPQTSPTSTTSAIQLSSHPLYYLSPCPLPQNPHCPVAISNPQDL